MFDFKSLLNDMEQSRRRSFLSVGVVCFLALALIIGLGVFSSTSQLREQPSASPTMTGRELFNKVVKQEKAALEKQAELEAQQAASEANKTSANQTSKNTEVKQKVQVNAKTVATKQIESATPTVEASPKAAAKQTSTSKEKENPYFSILHEPWPPSSDAGATKVESTFVPRLGSMFLMLCITCTIIWLSLKIFAPLFNKFTGATATPKKHINIVERKALAPNKSIVLLETHGRHLLLGMTDQSITTLANFEITPSQLSSTSKENESQEISSESTDISAITPSESQSNQDSANSDSENQGKKKNLLKEVLSQHLSSLPLSKNQ